MLKKTLFLVAAVALLSALVYGRDAYSLAATAIDDVQDAAREMIPIETRIKQARRAIKDLESPIEDAMETIAREEVQVAKLEKQLRKTETQLTKDKDYIFRLKKALSSQSGNIILAGNTYSPKEVKASLTREFEHYKSFEVKSKQLGKILDARNARLVAAREKLEAMKAAQRQLRVDVENLEARLKMVEVAETTSELNIDDSQLSRTRELLDDIGTRLDVAEGMLKTRTHHVERIPLDDDTESEDIVEKVTSHFSPRVESVADHR